MFGQSQAQTKTQNLPYQRIGTHFSSASNSGSNSGPSSPSPVGPSGSRYSSNLSTNYTYDTQSFTSTRSSPLPIHPHPETNTNQLQPSLSPRDRYTPSFFMNTLGTNTSSRDNTNKIDSPSRHHRNRSKTPPPAGFGRFYNPSEDYGSTADYGSPSRATLEDLPPVASLMDFNAPVSSGRFNVESTTTKIDWGKNFGGDKSESDSSAKSSGGLDFTRKINKKSNVETTNSSFDFNLVRTNKDSESGNSKTVLIIGFPTHETDFVVRQFSNLGRVKRVEKSDGANWMKIEYEESEGVRAAMRMHRKVFKATWMVTVEIDESPTLFSDVPNFNTNGSHSRVNGTNGRQTSDSSNGLEVNGYGSLGRGTELNGNARITETTVNPRIIGGGLVATGKRKNTESSNNEQITKQQKQIVQQRNSKTNVFPNS
ncbi:hypothetical protein HK096_009332, partial [Nowakowskiella sp. JEL0078]